MTESASESAWACSSCTISMAVWAVLSSTSNVRTSSSAIASLSGGPWTTIVFAAFIDAMRTCPELLPERRDQRERMLVLWVSDSSTGSMSSTLMCSSLKVRVWDASVVDSPSSRLIIATTSGTCVVGPRTSRLLELLSGITVTPPSEGCGLRRPHRLRDEPP